MGEEELSLGTDARLPRPGVSRALALPLAGLIVGLAYTATAVRYQVGTLASPGPGLFPFIAGLTILLSSAVALIAEWRAPSLVPQPLGERFRRVPALLASLAAYTILLKPLGFLLAATALSAVVLVILGRRRAWSVLAIAVVLSAACSLIFRLLGVPLPAGTLGLG